MSTSEFVNNDENNNYYFKISPYKTYTLQARNTSYPHLHNIVLQMFNSTVKKYR